MHFSPLIKHNEPLQKPSFYHQSPSLTITMNHQEVHPVFRTTEPCPAFDEAGDAIAQRQVARSLDDVGPHRSGSVKQGGIHRWSMVDQW